MTTSDDIVTRLRDSYHHVSFRPRDFLPEKLCHYTSAGGLLGILESGVLRGTNYAYLNDASEIRYGDQFVRDVLGDYRKYSVGDARDVVEVMFRSLGQIAERIEFYLTCFCTEADLLSQWRGYGSVSGRYCIVFDPEQLYNATTMPERVYFGRVIYEREEQVEEVRSVVDRAVEAAEALAELDEAQKKLCARRICTVVFEKLVETICLFKHRGFREESEWRAVHWLQDIKQVEFDARSGVIRPFVSMFSGEGEPSKLPISEIIVGSSGLVAQARKSVELLLDKRGYTGVSVSDSGVPYRDT